MRFSNIGKLFSILAITLVFISATYADSITSIPVPSAWHNKGGSTLTINAIDSTGKISGSYINRATGYSCQDIAYPVTGWAYGTAITFTTIWQSAAESCNSITAWTGFLYKGEISTLWSLSINGSTSTAQIVRGTDTFWEAQKVTNKSLIQKQKKSKKLHKKGLGNDSAFLKKEK